MSSDLREQLAAALAIEIKPLSEVQLVYNAYKKILSGSVVQTPLPEAVHLRDENFPYWIKLENPDPSRPGEWVGAKSSVVIPCLDAGIFDQVGFRFEAERARALLYVPVLLRNPNCIHINMRHAQRGQGGIQGRHVYVEYYGKKRRKVAFTTRNDIAGADVLVTSFWTYRNWVQECAQSPAVYVRAGAQCTCCPQ
jgi:hypothetical protein